MAETPKNKASEFNDQAPIIHVDAVLEPGQPTPRGLKRYVPVAIVLVGITIFFVGGFQSLLSFDALAQNQAAILAWTGAHNVLAVAVFILAYVVVVGLSLPGGVILTLSGGLLFGGILGTIYVVIGATLGAAAIFLAARYAFADIFKSRAGSNLAKMEQGFRNNAFSYLLFLRLVPAFPFWLVNLVPALLDVRFRTYVVATFFGIIPGSAIFANVGAGLATVLEKGETPNLKIIFEPQILLPILALAGISLVPVIYKKIKGKSAS